jgi:hypothetical protein
MTDRQMTYDELAIALGKTPDAARQLVKRKRWKRTIGNDGKARITVPDDELEPDTSPPRIPNDRPDAVTILTSHIERLEAELTTVRAERDLLRERADAGVVATAQVEALGTLLAEARRPWWRRLIG